jgi:hypothetical protein
MVAAEELSLQVAIEVTFWLVPLLKFAMAV